MLGTLTSSAAIGLALVAGAAIVDVSPWLATMVALGLVVSSPWLRHRVRQHRAGATTGPTAQPTHDDVAAAAGLRRAVTPENDPVQRLTNAQLCTAWRTSFVDLERARTSSQRMRLVALRQAYLDEIETRDPGALSAWLDAGARAAGGPDRYLRDEPDPPD